MKRVLLLTGMCVFLLVSLSFAAAIPKMINYQGMLADSTDNPLTGTYTIIFRIYDDSTAGNLEWNESQNGIEVDNGLFNVTLGAVLPLDLPFDESYWLEVIVDDDTMPRIRFTSVGYAYRSVVADRAVVADSAIVIVAAGSAFDSLHVTGNTRIDGDLHMGGTITHDSPVIIEDGLEFVDSAGNVIYHIEIDEEGEHPGTGMPDAMHGALGFESFADLNPYDMQVVFWDGVEERPSFIISDGEYMRASTFDHSLQVGKAHGEGAVDSNYTRFEGYKYIDGDTHGYGADLGVEHEIEAKGSIYSQDDIVAAGGDVTIGDGTTAYAGRIVLHDADAADGFTTTIASNTDMAADYTMTLPAADGTAGQVVITDGSGNLSWFTVGDITTVGSMVSADAFADTSADDDWLGLGAAAGRIEFDDQTVDEVNILDANVGIGTATPTARLHIGGIEGVDGIRFPDGSTMYTADIGSVNNLSSNATISIVADADADMAGDIDIRTGANSRIYIENAGNIGVGTQTPTANLDVVGTVRLQNVNSGFVESGVSGNLSTQKILTGTIYVGDVGADRGPCPVTGDLISAHKFDAGWGTDVIDVVFPGFGDAVFAVILSAESTGNRPNWDNCIFPPSCYWKENGVFRVYLQETSGLPQQITINVVIMDY